MAKRQKALRRNEACACELLEPRLFLSTTLADFGASAGANSYGTSWATPYVGPYTSYVDAGPDGVAGGSTGTYHTVGVSGAAARQFNVGDQVVVTWYNNNATSKTITPKISFDDLDYEGDGDAGTWSTMSQMTIPAYQSATATYTFTSQGSYYNVNTARNTNNISNVLVDKIELIENTLVSIAATDSSAAEPNNTGTFTVTRSGSTTGALAVNYTVSGTATNGTDYTSLSGTVTIPDGQATAVITVTPTNDNTVESSETVIVTLATGTGYGIGSPSSDTVNLADNDSTVSIAATDAAAAEPSNTGTFTVTRSGYTGAALTVNYNVTGTATNGTDYTSLGGTVTIPSGQTTATITVTPTNDNTVESTETAIVTLASGTDYTVGSPNSDTVNIADNDSTVTITATDASAAEPSNTGTFTVTRSGYTGAALTVNYNVSGTATNGTDYSSLSGTVTIPSGQTTATITVTPTDDTTDEASETAIVTLASGTDYTIGSPNAATVNIADDDPTIVNMVNFGSSAGNNTFATGWTTVYLGSYTAYDASGPAGITGGSTGVYHCAGISGSYAVSFNTGDQVKVTWYNKGASSRTFTPIISFDDLDYSGGGSDSGTWYTMSQMTVPAGTSATATFTFDASTQGSYYNINTARYTTNIADMLIDKIETYSNSDPSAVNVSITATDASAAEPSDTGTYTVTRNGSTSGALSVNYTVSGTATNGTDYSSLSGSVTIPDGQASVTITLTPTDDASIEGTETAIVTLASGSGYSIGSPNAATVNLADNDLYTVTIAATDPSAAEPSNTGTFTVTRAGGTSGALTVNFSKSGTATNGTDYNSIGTSVTIPNGQASATVTVTPIDDATQESTETVILTLSSGSGYSIGTPSAATVSIADDDTPTAQITGVSGTVNARQTITISGTNFGSGPDAVVFDDFEDGTLDAPINYGAGSAVVGQWDSTGTDVTYSDNYTISGDLALGGNMTNTNASKAVRNFAAGTNELFASWWVRVPEVMPGDGNVDGVNWKHVWILGNTTGDDDILVVFLGNPAQILVSGNCGTTTTYSSWSEGNGFDRGDWLRMEFYVKGGTTDGSYALTIWNPSTGNSTTVNMAAGQTWGGTPTPTQYETIGFNCYGRVTTDSFPMFDDTYSASGANCRARVVIGNASTYAACTNLSACATTSWSASSIDAKVNFGSLDTSGSLYMYVIKADGTVSPGYALTVSQAPLANNDIYTVATNGSLTASTPGVIANDIDLQGGTLSATKMSDPSHGSVTFNSNGSFTYNPTSNYYGPDSFTYRLSDGTNTGNTATVNISVRQKIVDFGDSAGNNTYGTAWTTVFKGPYVGYSSDGPDGLNGGTTTSTTYQGISGTARTFNVGEKIFVTWYNNTTAEIRFTPKISFDDPDEYNGGTSGTWYDMTNLTLAPGQTATTSYTITSGGSFSRINILRNLATNPLCDKIEIA